MTAAQTDACRGGHPFPWRSSPGIDQGRLHLISNNLLEFCFTRQQRDSQKFHSGTISPRRKPKADVFKHVFSAYEGSSVSSRVLRGCSCPPADSTQRIRARESAVKVNRGGVVCGSLWKIHGRELGEVKQLTALFPPPRHMHLHSHAHTHVCVHVQSHAST